MKLPTGSEVTRRRTDRPFEDGTAIQLDNVSMRYRLYRERIPSFKDYTILLLKRRVIREDFWALRDVSLRVERGQSFAIIGPNGAGKSSMLKMIARVLKPTTGRVRVRGLVAPLLEAGAGFHPEL